MNASKDRIKLLFLCAANSCRSQMAEGLAKARMDKGVEIYSAGTKMKRVHPTAIEVMREAGIDISQYKSKTLDSLPVLDFDLVITLCDQAAESCPILPGNPELVHWNLPDPDRKKGDKESVHAVFRESRDNIRRLLDDLFERGYLKALVHAKRDAQLILDNIAEGIIAHDLKRRVFYFNKAAEEITGYKREAVINRDCHDVFPGGLCSGKCDFSGEGIPCFESTTRSLDVATRNGEKRRVEMMIRTMKNDSGDMTGVLASFRDTTREYELARSVEKMQQFSGIIGCDKKMLEIYDLIRDLSDSSPPVLIQGESGTGKELIAAAVHNEGPRGNRLFVPVNCGALPEGLLESELFGHVRGAFTGAIRDKKGRFELADGGTIFLDEIGDLPPSMQVKLLRVLQDGTFERVGSEKTTRVDVRVISATNRDLAKESLEGKFREDLYYRLSVVPIRIPPLRERRNDIPLLVDHVLGRFVEEMGRKGVTMSDAALDFMMSYDWPGNIRELQNWIQFALVKCRSGEIGLEHLPPDHVGIAAPPRRRRQRKLSVSLVRGALKAANGNKVNAARELGVSRATLYRFLDEHPLPE